jgi:hypothetical protein
VLIRIRNKRYFMSPRGVLKVALDTPLEWVGQEVLGPNTVRLKLRNEDGTPLTCVLFLSEMRRTLKCL